MEVVYFILMSRQQPARVRDEQPPGSLHGVLTSPDGQRRVEEMPGFAGEGMQVLQY